MDSDFVCLSSSLPVCLYYGEDALVISECKGVLQTRRLHYGIQIVQSAAAAAATHVLWITINCDNRSNGKHAGYGNAQMASCLFGMHVCLCAGDRVMILISVE